MGAGADDDGPTDDGPGAQSAAVAADKASLRHRIRAARRARALRGDSADALDLRRQAARVPEVADLLERAGHGTSAVATAYIALPGEPDVSGVRALLRDAGVRVLLPVVLDGPGHAMAWGLDGTSLRPGRRLPGGRRLLEPEPDPAASPVHAQLLLVPALAADRGGARLGHGGGYYDRVLPTVAPGARIVAVVHDDELLEAGAVPASVHDVRVHAVLTPRRFVRTASG